MRLFGKKKTTDLRQEIENQAYMEESLNQAKGVGIAKAKAEAKQAKKMPAKKSGLGKFVGVMQSKGVQDFGKNLGESFNFGSPQPPPKEKNKKKKGFDMFGY